MKEIQPRKENSAPVDVRNSCFPRLERYFNRVRNPNSDSIKINSPGHAGIFHKLRNSGVLLWRELNSGRAAFLFIGAVSNEHFYHG